MTSYLRSALVLVSAALLAACGGRSQLRDSSAASSGSGGAGPTTSSVSVSSGGGFGGTGGFVDVGGSGGMLSGCVVDGEPIGLAGTEGYGTSDPVFVVPVQVDTTTLVAGWKTTEGPMNPPTELRHTSFQPWGPWPADGTLGPSYLADYDGSQELSAAPSSTDFSLVFAPPPPGFDLTYLSHLIPGSGALGTTEAIKTGPARPSFLERGTDPHVHLLGFVAPPSGIQIFGVARKDDALPGAAINSSVGCAVSPILAAAAAVGPDFLVAFSSGSAFADSGCPAGNVTSTAHRLFIIHVDKSATATLAEEIKATRDGDTITSLKLVQRLDGAWVAWTDTFKGGLHVVRLTSTGKVADGPITVPFFGDPASISATSLGDRLALAWSATAADAPSQIRINVLSTAGNLDADLSINLGPPAMGRTALLGSPSNKSLLVAWSEEVSPGPQIRLARLACSLP